MECLHVYSRGLRMIRLVWVVALVTSTVSAGEAGDDLKYLAEAIYFEARSEPLACQIIVAQTILNRVSQSRFEDSVEGVVHQKKWSETLNRSVCQYSYFCDGKPDILQNTKAELVAYQVASMVLLRQIPDLSEGADHYYAHEITTPSWEPSLEATFVCDKHTFGILNW